MILLFNLLKVLAIVQARMGSTRLPGKVLMKIEGKTILEHVINFLQFSKNIDDIIVATTDEPTDDEIEVLIKNLGVKCYRGSSSDVLKRYYDCAKQFKGDIIVRITADDPIVDPVLIDKVIDKCKNTRCDYATNLLHRTYPLGISGEAFSFTMLEKLYVNQLDLLSREHVTHDMLINPKLYDIEEVFAPPGLERPSWRLTVDYMEDLQLMRKIFSALYKPNSFIKYESLVDFLDKNQKLFDINNKYS
jgi:spore coat polysaccharide biosynthesis protein SpsF